MKKNKKRRTHLLTFSINLYINQSYTMRNGILTAMGNIVCKVLSGEGLNEKARTTRDKLLDKLEVKLSLLKCPCKAWVFKLVVTTLSGSPKCFDLVKTLEESKTVPKFCRKKSGKPLNITYFKRCKIKHHLATKALYQRK